MAVKFAVKHSRTSEYRFFPEDITIMPELNGRQEKPDIEWLITDILANDQHTPVVIRNDGGLATLVAGFSRWRAISMINERKLAGVKLQVRCTYVQCDEQEAFLINISENRFRNPVTPIDDAHNIKRLLNKYAMTEEQVAATYFPTAKTESELKEARKFVKERIALISLAPEVAQAVREGRVKESAAGAIAKLSQVQQRQLLEKDGTIARKDVVPPKPRKVLPLDGELKRRIGAMFDDIATMLNIQELQYIEVDRKLLLNLYTYVEEIKALK